jgi:hypothetical protein
MGYGARALESLNSFYSGELYNFDDAPADLGESFADAAQVAPVSTTPVFCSAELTCRAHHYSPIVSA